MKAWDIAPTAQATKRSTAPTVSTWIDCYIELRTGVTKATIYDDKSYLRLDIASVLGQNPLDALAGDDISDWVQGLEERDLAPTRIHDMRHTCASWMISGGASMLPVRRHLSHESISTTINLYSHLDTKDAEAAAAIIGNARRR